MHPVSPLRLASLLALALTSCNGNDRPPAAADSPAAGSTPAITDASLGGPPPARRASPQPRQLPLHRPLRSGAAASRWWACIRMRRPRPCS